MNQKLTMVALALAVAVVSSASAQRYDESVGDLIRYERLSPQDAATVFALSKGLGVSPDYVISARRSIGKTYWVIGPAISIANKQRRDPRAVWDLHNRGQSWDEIERNRYDVRNDDRYERRRHGDHWDYYDGRTWRCSDDRWNDDYRNEERRRHGDHWDYYDGRTWRCSNDRWNDDYRNDDRGRTDRGGLGGVVGDILDDVLGNRQRDNRPYNDRYDNKWRDKEYERSFWQGLFSRAYWQSTNSIWRYVGNGMNIDDVALASHIARVSRNRVEEVASEFVRNRNWGRVRDLFGVRSDWDSYDSRRDNRRYDDRYRDRP